MILNQKCCQSAEFDRKTVSDKDLEKTIQLLLLNGILEGTALGDSLGLPFEGLSHKSIIRGFPLSLKQSFLFGRGMISDDTEQTILVAQALIVGRHDSRRFLKSFSRRYRYWFLCLPAGMGGASARAGLKLLAGFSPRQSGVFSAGNAPAMRSAIIGAYYYDRPDLRSEFVRVATEMTHTDPKALVGAMAVSELAALSVRRKIQGESLRPNPDSLLALLTEIAPDDLQWQELLATFRSSLEKKETPLTFAERIGAKKGVSGYVYQSVPIAIYIWYYNYYSSLKSLMTDVIACGGDTDTVGAITGALAGSVSHLSRMELLYLSSQAKLNFPNNLFSEELFLVSTNRHCRKYLDHICDFPFTTGYLDRLSIALNHAKFEEKTSVPFYHFLACPFRNLFFLLMIFIHLFSRLKYVILNLFDPRNICYQRKLKTMICEKKIRDFEEIIFNDDDAPIQYSKIEFKYKEVESTQKLPCLELWMVASNDLGTIHLWFTGVERITLINKTFGNFEFLLAIEVEPEEGLWQNTHFYHVYDRMNIENFEFFCTDFEYSIEK